MKYIILFTNRNGTESWLHRQSHDLWGFIANPTDARRFTSQMGAIRMLDHLTGHGHIELNGDETIEIQPVQE